MKKAYVKPVFLAEAFEGTASVASCGYDADAANSAIQIWHGKNLCTVGDGGHYVGKDNGNKHPDVAQWWDYATNTNGANTNPPKSNSLSGFNNGAYLFTDGQTVCDFVWNSVDSDVGIWTSEKDNASTAIWDVTVRNNSVFNQNLFVTFIKGFAAFFGIEPDEDKNHKPGIKGQGAFFS